MADNQSRKYKVTWLDNISAYTGRAYDRSSKPQYSHTVIFSGLYDYDKTNIEDGSQEQIVFNKFGDVVPEAENHKKDGKELWNNWHNDYNIYKGGVRYTKFVDVADDIIYIDDYKLELKFDYPSGIVSLEKSFVDNQKYYIGQKNPRSLEDTDFEDIIIEKKEIITKQADDESENESYYVNCIADYRTNNFNEFAQKAKYYIVIPASLYNCGYMPMHDIEEADLQQDENSYHKFYITHNKISYVCFMSNYAANKYVGIIGKKL